MKTGVKKEAKKVGGGRNIVGGGLREWVEKERRMEG